MTVLTSTDEGLLSYLNRIMSQMNAWLIDGHVRRFVVVVTGIDSNMTLERWQFNVTVDGIDDATTALSVSGKNGGDENKSRNALAKAPSNLTKAKMKKSIREIHNEIQAIIRQITASVRIADETSHIQVCHSIGLWIP